jgi:EmrB/QacA subfamily drug resistance transporter
MAALMVAMFMAAVEATIVATAMPTIVADLGGFSLFSWVFAIFLLTQAVTIPVYGKLADVYGRKPVFFFGATLFLIGSTLCGFSWSMEALIAFRALQGLGAGAVQPIAVTVVGDIYSPAERARIQGYLASVWGISSVVGPALGAFFVQKLHWALVFWVNLPIGLASMAMLAVFLHEGVQRRPHRIDYLGSALLMVGTSALMLALIQGSSLTGSMLAGLVALAAAALVGFLAHERRAPEPMMPLDLWRYRVIAVGNLGALTTGALIMGITSFLPAYVQGVMGRPATVAGFALAMMSIGWPLSSTAGGRLMVHTSYRFVAILGGVGLIAGCAVLVVLTPERGPLWAGSGSFLVGIGMGFTSSTLLVAIQSSVNWSRRGVGTSGFMFMRIVGQALGAAAFGAVLNYGVHRGAPGQGDVINLLMKPATRGELAPALLDSLTQVMATSLRQVYAIGGVLALATLVLALGLPSGLRPSHQNPGP